MFKSSYMSKILTIQICIILFNPSPVLAQDYTGDMGMLYTDIGMSGAMMDSATESGIFSAETVRTSFEKNIIDIVASKNSVRISGNTTSFNHSMQQQKKNLAQFVAKAKNANQKGGAQLEIIFTSTDIIADVGKGIAPYGLKTNNVADAYAVYWMTAWQAAHGDTSDFTRAQSQAVKQQAANALLATPEFISATDAIKQEMAEAYLVQAALIQASVDVAQTDRTIAKGLPSAVRKGAKASGLDLDAMTLTDEGFVPARKDSDE